MRPSGLTSSSQPSSTQPQPTSGSQSRSRTRAADEGSHADPGEPAQRADRAEAERGEHLGGLGRDRHREDGGVLPAGRGRHVVEGRGELGEAGVVVDVGDGDLGEALAQPAHELGGGQAAAAEVEEVVVGAGRGAPEDGRPVAGHPGGRALDAGRVDGCRRPGSRGRRPGQRVAVDLPGGAGREGVDDRQPRDERGRHRGAQPLDGGLGVEAGLGRDVADEQAVARLAAAHGRRRPAHAREGEQRAVDLAELDAAAADLDLVVGPAVEDQALAVEPHDVPAAVGAVPAQRGHRGVDDLVLGRVEVAGQADAADDQLARLAVGHPVALGVDDGQVPAVEGQPDAHRRLAGEPGAAGDDGGLGGAVGVPDLAVGGGEAGADLGWAGLAAEDEEAHVVEGGRRPEGDEGRHRRHDGDVVGAGATARGPCRT